MGNGSNAVAHLFTYKHKGCKQRRRGKEPIQQGLEDVHFAKWRVAQLLREHHRTLQDGWNHLDKGKQTTLSRKTLHRVV